MTSHTRKEDAHKTSELLLEEAAKSRCDLDLAWTCHYKIGKPRQHKPLTPKKPSGRSIEETKLFFPHPTHW